MAYTQQTWIDGTSGTSITASRLNHMEAGIAAVAAPTKSDVGLGNVDNTADTAKPVSAAQAAYATSRAVALALVLGS